MDLSTYSGGQVVLMMCTQLNQMHKLVVSSRGSTLNLQRFNHKVIWDSGIPCQGLLFTMEYQEGGYHL